MPRPHVESLEYDEDVEDHLDAHGVAVDDIYDMLEEDDWVLIRNKKKHPASHKRIVGRLPNGQLLTAILEETRTRGVWKPVTAFPSSPAEAALYEQARRHKNA